MKTIGEGFKYFLDEKQVLDFDAFEKATKKVEITIKIDGLNVRAKTV